MSIYLWSSEPSKIYVWSSEVSAVYVWTTKVRPAGWTPWSNTIAYYPLTSSTTVNDISGNNRNLTNNGTQFWTYAGVNCAYFPSINSRKLYWSLPLSWTQNFTFNVWINRQWSSTSWYTNAQIINLWNPWTNYAQFWIAIWDNNTQNPNKYVAWTRWNDKYSSSTNTTNTWNMITVTHQSWTVKMYVNSTIVINSTISFNIANTNFTVWSFQWDIGENNYGTYYWYMSELICESSIWNSDYITYYYNLTKSKYWL